MCSELKSRHASRGYVNDEAYAEAVVERIFRDPRHDLLSIFPPSMGAYTNEYHQVLEIIWCKSLAFQVRLSSLSSEVWFL